MARKRRYYSYETVLMFLKVMVDISVVSALRVQVKFFCQISTHRFLYLLHVYEYGNSILSAAGNF